ncbi:MAG TPA: hypothetical protein VHR97_00160 [Candidatus Baltobacteraceae bacterium]|jgi:hypothetical protein|nr:hypothetical protein [Candidatus Baltobacteraceae bacterium]
MTPQTSFGENLLGTLMVDAGQALAANKQTIETDLGEFNPKIENGILTLEGDLEGKLNPVLKALVQGAFAMLNPIIDGQLPTIEGSGLDWLIATLETEGKKLQG